MVESLLTAAASATAQGASSPALPEPGPAASASPAATAMRARSALGTRVHLYSELGKFRLNVMVLVTTFVGFLMVAPQPLDVSLLAVTLIGTLLIACGSAAFNSLLETDRDARMKRTRTRPVPSGELSQAEALAFATVASVAGFELLAFCVNTLTASLALATWVIYVAIYTPMKTRSTMSTMVGGVCGALPPMMGVAAAVGTLTPEAWLLGGILFVWQIPHFLALAWMYRDDYERGGFRMLPIVDPTGDLTARQMLLYSFVLLPVGVVAALAGISGWFAAVGATILGVVLVVRARRFLVERTARNARRVFLFTLLYLPCLLGLLVLDKGPALTPSFHTTDTAPPVATP